MLRLFSCRRPVIAASYSTRDAGWETNPECYAMPDYLKAVNGKTFWVDFFPQYQNLLPYLTAPVSGSPGSASCRSLSSWLP